MSFSNHSIIKLRRGTAAEWAASLPQPGGEVLRLGEPGYEKDTRKLKIGNGIDGWNNLDYINAAIPINPEDIEDIIGSGFLVAGTGINLSYNDGADSLTISTSGVSFSGHTHTSSNITDFNSSVSGLLPSISGSDYVSSSFNNNIYTISVSGLQPSGNYSLVGHTHNISDIIDFDSSVIVYTTGNQTIDGVKTFTDNIFINDLLVSVKPISEGMTLNLADTQLSGHRFKIINIDNYGDLNSYTITLPDDSLPGDCIILSFGTVISDITIRMRNHNGSGYGPMYTPMGFVRGSIYPINRSYIYYSDSDNSIPAGFYRAWINIPSSEHNHGNITDHGEIGSVSGLLVITSDNGLLTTTSGINSNYITNFESAVSGLLPVKDIISGSGINIINNTGLYTINIANSGVTTQKLADDSVTADKIAPNQTVQFGGIIVSDGYSLSKIVNLRDTGFVMSNESGILQTPSYYFSISPYGIVEDGIWNATPISVEYGGTNSTTPSGARANLGLSYGSVSGTVCQGDDPRLSDARVPLSHYHLSSDITDFDSSVSGLLPVKDIVAGTGIDVTSSSGVFTINSSNTVSADTLEPDGFVNRTDSTISFDDSSREFSIAPKSPATSYAIYNNGVKVVKSTTETTTLPDTTALYYIHFDKSTNNLSYKTTGFNFDTDIPVAQIYYNADDNKAVYFGEERHGIRMDASTHRYLHNVFGTQYVNGLSISNYSTSGDGSADSDATVAIGDGLIYDEDIDVNITNSASPSDPFEQILYPIAQIPVYYKVGSNGAWTDTTANNFPVKVGTTAQYNLNSAGVWSAADSDAPSNNRYLASWICATSQEHAPIIAIMGQRLDSSLEQATSNNSWGDLNLNGLPIVELRPLYRLIYDTKSSFANGAKAFLVHVLDIRSHIDTITGLPQNDHGNLYGLADDDHYQYVHINEARTIDAIHTFSNGLSASGLINAASGNFTSLTVNSTGVSLEGHTHTASNISDFDSTVSGLLPTISNSGDNRILTSDGTSTGIVAESGFNFDNSTRQFKIIYDNTVGHSGYNSLGNIRLESYGSSPTLGGIANRIIAFRDLGSETSPSGLIDGNAILSIRGDALNSSGNPVSMSRILMQTEGSATSGNLYVPTKLSLNTSSGPNQLDNSLILHSDGKLYSNGYLQIFQTNNRLDPSPNSGKNYGLGVYIGTSGLSGSVDPNSPHTIYGIGSNVSPRSPNSNHTMYYTGNVAGVYSELPSGVANSGAIYGSIAGAWRNSRGANVGDGWYDDNGTLSELFGSVINYGHSLGQSGIYGPAPTGLTSYTENAYGLYIGSHKGYGTINVAYDLLIADTNYNTGTINNHYAIYQIGNRSNYLEGSLSVDNGVSAPTPIYNLGAVSGNTAISYAINRQIQKLTLNGTAVNFTEGTGWDISNRSVDVMLEITVSSLTTVSFDAGFVTDWYNPLPTFSSGKHLILLRSMGVGVVQGHYIGAKTN